MSKAIITEQHLHDIADAIIAKGGATAALTPAQMPAAIQSIKTGEWVKPDDWPDLRKIVADDTHNYSYKVGMLFDASDIDIIIAAYPGVSAYFSDGALIENIPTSPTTHVWDDERDINGRYRYVILLSNSETLKFTSDKIGSSGENLKSLLWVASSPGTIIATYNIGFFRRCVSLQSVEAKEMIVSDGNCYSTFERTWSLKNLDCERIKLSEGWNGGEFVGTGLLKFGGKIFATTSDSNLSADASYAPTHFSHWDFGGIKSWNNKLRNSYMTLPPDELIAMSLTSDSVIDGGMDRVLGTPIKLNVSSNFSLTATSYAMCYRSRFADFDANGNLVGGMAFNMNEVSGLTATISATIKGFFTATEQATIEAAFNAKGWTLAW